RGRAGVFEKQGEPPHVYMNPQDIEVAALLSAAMAYGRVDLFKPRLISVLDALGPSPASVARNSSPDELLRRAHGFAYRMTGPPDVACLLYGSGAMLRGHGFVVVLFRADYTCVYMRCD